MFDGLRPADLVQFFVRVKSRVQFHSWRSAAQQNRVSLGNADIELIGNCTSSDVRDEEKVHNFLISSGRITSRGTVDVRNIASRACTMTCTPFEPKLLGIKFSVAG